MRKESTKLIFLILLISTQAIAEYRVYQYSIDYLDTNNQIEKNVIISTTLNKTAYKTYYGINQQNIQLLRTWICPGNTSQKLICLSPYEKMEM